MHLFIAIFCFTLWLIYCFFETLLLFLPRQFKYKKELTGQKVLITGAGSGLGRELAIQFSKHCVCLVLVDINRKSLMGTEKLLDRKSRVYCYDCDVSDREKVYKVSNTIKKEIGNMDIIVNNAGIVSGNYLMDIPDEDIVKTMEVNVLAHFWVIKSFLPAMMARNHGHIVCVSSIAGKAVAPKLTDYCASKFAAVGFAECLEMELREKNLDGIKVTIICPNHINTGLFDGLKTRVAPSLSAEYVAQEVVTGVLEEKEVVYLPHYLGPLYKLQTLTPRWLRVKFFEMSGDIKAMENFTGRILNDNTLKKEK